MNLGLSSAFRNLDNGKKTEQFIHIKPDQRFETDPLTKETLIAKGRNLQIIKIKS